MKKTLLLAFIFFGAAAVYARVSPYVNSLLPRDRQALAQAMLQSADAYEKAGNKKRALEYRKAALDVFPIGDEAHALARSLDITLNDEETYTVSINNGDTAYKARNYRQAVVDYMMALELRQPIELYEKLQLSYLGLGDESGSEAFQSEINKVKAAPAEGITYDDNEEYYEEAYQAEAEEAYPQEYPLDGYGDSSEDETPVE